MNRRTKTYIAADWTGDIEAVEQLRKWNESSHWSLYFLDVHECFQCRDSSLACTIKNSLRERMNMSKKFVLIVGDKTKDLTKGSCYLCDSYNSYTRCCAKGHCVNNLSFVEYECHLAVEADIEIIVLYNSSFVDKSLCPEPVRDKGVHVAMKKAKLFDEPEWDYESVKDVLLK